MKKIGYERAPKYNWYEKVDALALECVNILVELKYRLDWVFGGYRFLKKNIELKDKHKGRKAFVLGNGPSLNKHDLTLLKDELVFMVNRSFSHPDYRVIKPQYHLFVDPKLATGQWPLTYLDEIRRLNPDCTLLLNAKWYDLPHFQRIKESMRVYWLKTKTISLIFPGSFKVDLTSLSTSYCVLEQAVTSAIYMGVREIYLLGFEGDGVVRLIMNQNSHFSGKDPDYKDSTSFDYARAMHYNSRGIRIWYALVQNCDERGVRIVNLTDGGLMNMMPVDIYENVISA